MSAPIIQPEDKARMAHHEILQRTEEIEMKFGMGVTKIKKMWQSTGLATQHPVKLLAGLALGALLMTGTALHFTPNSVDEGSSSANIARMADSFIYYDEAQEADPYEFQPSVSQGSVNPFINYDEAQDTF